MYTLYTQWFLQFFCTHTCVSIGAIAIAADIGGAATTANEMQNNIIISFYMVQYSNEFLAQNSYSFYHHVGTFNSWHFVIAS